MLSGGEIDRLLAASERPLPFVHEPPGDLQPLHGDLHPGNIVGAGDGLVWIDFEDVCLGPPAWDLALLNWMDAGAVAAHHRPDPDLLAQVQRVTRAAPGDVLDRIPGGSGRPGQLGRPYP